MMVLSIIGAITITVALYFVGLSLSDEYYTWRNANNHFVNDMNEYRRRVSEAWRRLVISLLFFLIVAGIWWWLIGSHFIHIKIGWK